MEIVRILLLNIKSHFSKLSKFKKTDPFSIIQNVNKNRSMEEQKVESYENDIPKKKLCVEGENEVSNVTDQRIKKRKVAILLGYNGKNYHGMQRNTGFQTIEESLLQALVKVELVPPEAMNNLKLVNFQRAARTDKGVSAAKQVVSLKIAENYDVESLNSYLPNDIRVFSIKRVTKGFDSKINCVARTYSYTLPTYALAPELHEEYPENYRISEDAIQKANEILSTFLGTHNFFNFTIRRTYEDPSVKRYILTFQVEKPFVDGEEFVTIKVKGQSFMMHQIRKMVGYTILYLKDLLPPDVKERVWTSEKVPTPLAPSLGLVLENIHYDRYDKKFGNDGMHSSLTWDDVADEVENFRKKFILSDIIKTEITERSMFNWIHEAGYDLKHKKVESESNGKDLSEDKGEEEIQQKN